MYNAATRQGRQHVCVMCVLALVFEVRQLCNLAGCWPCACHAVMQSRAQVSPELRSVKTTHPTSSCTKTAQEARHCITGTAVAPAGTNLRSLQRASSCAYASSSTTNALLAAWRSGRHRARDEPHPTTSPMAEDCVVWYKSGHSG